MNRLEDRLRKARASGRGALMPFLVLGDPDMETSARLLDALVRGGADALELGFPFSDPPADGPAIQAADLRALNSGMRTEQCFELLEGLQGHHDIPVSLLVYYNLVLQYGIEAFYARAAKAGVDAVLVADAPLEETEMVVAAARATGVAPIFIVSELTTQDRLQKLLAVAEAYLYVVMRVGITGERTEVAETAAGMLGRLKAATDLPLCCGFGISSPEQVAQVIGLGADAAIVGSALVRRIEAHLDDSEAMVATVHDFTRALAFGLGPREAQS